MKLQGCFRSGCSTLIGAVVLMALVGFCNSLARDALNDNETRNSRAVSSTTLPRTIVVEEPEPQPPKIEPVQPQTEEVVEPVPEDSVEPIIEAVLADVVPDTPDPYEMVSRTYEWEYGGSSWTWEATVSKTGYEYFQGIPRLPTANYSVYVTHPADDPYIDGVVRKIREAAEEKGFSEYQTVEFAIAFVQSMPYTVDSVTSPFDEYPRYPAETLIDGGGDCEDTAILLASLLDSMGFGVVLIRLPDHMAIGVMGGENTTGSYWEYGGDKYFYVETTDPGWGIGELPDEYADTSATVLPLKPVPIVTHEWVIEGQGAFAVLTVTVNNLGTATASDMYAYAAFDAGEGMVWREKQSDVFSLEPGQSVTATMSLLAPPLGERTRLVVRIVMGEHVVDESYSDWVDT